MVYLHIFLLIKSTRNKFIFLKTGGIISLYLVNEDCQLFPIHMIMVTQVKVVLFLPIYRSSESFQLLDCHGPLHLDKWQ
jgi:hypothetical protein